MSMLNKIAQDLLAGVSESVKTETPGKTVQTADRLRRYGDDKTEELLKVTLKWFLWWFAAIALFAAMPINLLLLAAGVFPFIAAFHFFMQRPFTYMLGGVADESLFEGKIRRFVLLVAGLEISATVALWLIPIQNDRELALWLIFAVAGIGLLALAGVNNGARTFLTVVAIGIVLVLVLGGRGGVQDKIDNAKKQDVPEQVAPQERPANHVAPEKADTGTVSTTSAVSAAPQSPFYTAKECAGEPEGRSFAPDDPSRKITVQAGCWTSPIKVPSGTAFGVDSSGPVDIMYINNEVVNGYGATGYRIDGSMPGFQTFRLRGTDAPEQVTIILNP